MLLKDALNKKGEMAWLMPFINAQMAETVTKKRTKPVAEQSVARCATAEEAAAAAAKADQLENGTERAVEILTSFN